MRACISGAQVLVFPVFITFFAISRVCRRGERGVRRWRKWVSCGDRSLGLEPSRSFQDSFLVCLVRQRAGHCRRRITGQYCIGATALAALAQRGTERLGVDHTVGFLPLLCTRVSAGVNAAPGEMTSISLLEERFVASFFGPLQK